MVPVSRDARLGHVREDAELIAATRGGDAAAFGELYERHAGAAWVVARQYTASRADADDVVADSFAAVYSALIGGSGPDVAFRAYLFTVVRRGAATRRAQGARVEPTDDARTFETAGVPVAAAEEPALAGFENGLVAGAFRSLPERWQAVLWYTEVEGLAPAKVAPLLGLTANGVAALAYRAREGLRQAYLQEHLGGTADEACRGVGDLLGAYVRGGLAVRDTRRVEEHLDGCGRCRTVVLELDDVNHGLRGIVAPLVLGVAGLGALAHELPVGGGLAAGAAATGGAGAAGAAGASGGAAAGAEVAATGGVTTAGAVGTGAAGGAGAVAASTAVGAGAGALAGAGAAASGAATVGGLTAMLSSVPVVAAAAGAVLVGAVVVTGVVSGGGGDPGAAPVPSASSEAGSLLGGGTATGGSTPTPTPSAGPTSVPADLLAPADESSGTLLGAPAGSAGGTDGSASTQAQADTSTTADGSTTGGSGSDGGTTTPGTTIPGDPAPAPDPGPAPPEPAAVTVALAGDASQFEAGAGSQSLLVDVTNSGGSPTGALTATISLPTGVSVDEVVQALQASTVGVFAPAEVEGWSCVAAPDRTGASCVLATLGPKQTSRLTLRVSVDEALEAADAAVGVAVSGGGVSVQTTPLRMRIAASPARVTAPSTPSSVQLVAGRARELAVPVRNVGGSATSAAQPAVVRLSLPAGVSWSSASSTDGWACSAQDGAVLCVRDVLAARESSTVRLLLTAAGTTADGASIGVELDPPGRQARERRSVAVQVAEPARLTLVGGDPVVVEPGSGDLPVGLTVRNDGGLAATDVRVLLVTSNAVKVTTSDSSGWSCWTTGSVGAQVPGVELGGALTTCTADELAPGEQRALPVSVRVPYGQAGGLVLVASAVATDADPAVAVHVFATQAPRR